MNKKAVQLFVTGIDTDIGKSVVTGMAAKHFILNNKTTTTMKLVQTGCAGIAEDILIHRKIMGKTLDEFDNNGVTAPFVFSFPASPHLAAELEKKEVDIAHIDKSLKKLSENFEVVVIEGAGGIYVPLTRDFTTLDFVSERAIPTVVVSSPKLGSINHTMMTLEILKSRGVPIAAIVYNLHPDEKKEIVSDSINVIKHFSKKIGIESPFHTLPYITF
ncbi:MAG: dethiobiotin synthase [bacterium]